MILGDNVVLLAAAGAPLRWIDSRWCRVDLPEPLPPAPVDEGATWRLLDAELLEWHLPYLQPVLSRLRPSEDGLVEVETIRGLLATSSDGRPSRLEILQRLAAAGEAVQVVREPTEDELDESLCGPIVEWVEPDRCGPWGWTKPRPVICYGDELRALAALGLVIDVGGRALLTGAGRWVAAPSGLAATETRRAAKRLGGAAVAPDAS